MNIKLHDQYGHGVESVKDAISTHSQAHECPLMRHLAQRSEIIGAEIAIIEALTGEDSKAVSIANDIVLANDNVARHHPVTIEALAHTCGGIDVNVALALLPWFADEISIEGEDGSGMAWETTTLRIQPSDCGGAIIASNGMVWIGSPLPMTLATGATKHTVGEVITAPTWLGHRRIIGCDAGVDELLLEDPRNETDLAA